MFLLTLLYKIVTLTTDFRVELEELEEDVDAVCAGVAHDGIVPAGLDFEDLVHTGDGREHTCISNKLLDTAVHTKILEITPLNCLLTCVFTCGWT